jgi:hypothetical protein
MFPTWPLVSPLRQSSTCFQYLKFAPRAPVRRPVIDSCGDHANTLVDDKSLEQFQPVDVLPETESEDYLVLGIYTITGISFGCPVM